MITCWPSLRRPAEGSPATDGAIVARARAPRIYARKDHVPRWAGAEFRDGYRDLEHWLSASWIVLDLDDGATREQLERSFGDWTGFAHTTWSSTAEVRRWRVAGQLDRPVDTRDDFDRVWRAAASLAEAHGLVPDYSARDASRAWALPARHDGDAYEHLEFRGALFDVVQALERFPKPEPLPEPERAPRDDSYSHRLGRARRYLERMPGAIAGSGGHRTTFAAALAMVRGFALDPDDALRLLLDVHNPICQPAWTRRELAHKVRQALQRGRTAPGWLADRPRERRAG